MKNLLMTASLAACMSLPVTADADLSISLGEPGFHGEIQIGDFPRPRLLYREPVLISRVSAPPPAIYVVVPPGHARNWEKHCHDYGYCGRPVYFVEEAWYQDVYVPEYRKRHSGKGKGHKKGKGEK